MLRCSFSDSEEKESTKDDNVAHLNFQLKYEADLLFTRCGAGGHRAGALHHCLLPRLKNQQ